MQDGMEINVKTKRMERTKRNKKVSAILCSDFHLREDTPSCFTGDFQKEQWVALNFIKQYQAMHNCPVIVAGDIFHHWKPSPYLISKTMEWIPDKTYAIFGQHDLPQHSLDLARKSGLWTLMEGGKIKILGGWHYGQDPNKGEGGMLGPGGKIICVWHHLTYISKPFPGAEGGMAEGILRKYPQFDLIVTGDNHCSFTVEYKGRRLVNPGNITRQVADQIDFQPRVALWYAEDNSIQWVNLPKQEGVISREHIDRVQERNDRIDAFVSRLGGDWQATMSFEDNLDTFFAQTQVRDSVKQIIYNAIDK